MRSKGVYSPVMDRSFQAPLIAAEGRSGVDMPGPTRWVHFPDISCLYWHFACIASVNEAGRVSISRHEKQVTGQAASRVQGIRHIERWLRANGWHAAKPLKPRRPPADHSCFQSAPPSPTARMGSGLLASDANLIYRAPGRTYSWD